MHKQNLDQASLASMDQTKAYNIFDKIIQPNNLLLRVHRKMSKNQNFTFARLSSLSTILDKIFCSRRNLNLENHYYVNKGNFRYKFKC
jgi:hypothetical protein